MMTLISSMSLYAQDSDAPDMALLEFLGEGVKVEDEVIDPMTWQAIEEMTGETTNSKQSDNNRRQGNE